MQTYRAYYERGYFVPLVNLELPEGSQAVFTILEENPEDISLRQRAAMSNFREIMSSSGPLPAGYDDVVKDRMKIAREIEL